jgi:hypothetical protein
MATLKDHALAAGHRRKPRSPGFMIRYTTWRDTIVIVLQSRACRDRPQKTSRGPSVRRSLLDYAGGRF